MSIGVSVFILVNAVKSLKEIVNVFLEKVPDGIEVAEIKEHISEIDGVIDVHHIHIWSMDGHNNCATMHIITDGEADKIKEEVREELYAHGIHHATLELETSSECCDKKQCCPEHTPHSHHHHHSHTHKH